MAPFDIAHHQHPIDEILDQERQGLEVSHGNSIFQPELQFWTGTWPKGRQLLQRRLWFSFEIHRDLKSHRALKGAISFASWEPAFCCREKATAPWQSAQDCNQGQFSSQFHNMIGSKEHTFQESAENWKVSTLAGHWHFLIIAPANGNRKHVGGARGAWSRAFRARVPVSMRGLSALYVGRHLACCPGCDQRASAAPSVKQVDSKLCVMTQMYRDLKALFCQRVCLLNVKTWGGGGGEQ